MDFKDYYDILGVPPDADDKTIKQAFRKLARQHHPDVNPGNKEAEDRFKSINEAYQALSTPEARHKYDELRAQYQRWQQSGRPGQDFNYQRWSAQPGEGPDVYYTSPEDMEDLFGGDNPFSDFFTTLYGNARARSRPSGPRRGQDIEAEVELSLEEAYQGSVRLVQLGDRRIEARIPRGVRTGSRVRLAGQGEPGRGGGAAGDLYLVVGLQPHPQFELEGDDLHVEVPVDFFTAVTGGEVPVPTLDRPLLLKIPPQTQAGRSFRLRGKGLPRLGGSGTPGDLLARVKLVLPDDLSQEELKVLSDLAARRTSQPA